MSSFGCSVQVSSYPRKFYEEHITLTRLLETKNKTLEELDIFFGGSIDSIAEADRARMQRINESLGIAHAEQVEDLRERAASFGAEKVKTADDS